MDFGPLMGLAALGGLLWAATRGQKTPALSQQAPAGTAPAAGEAPDPRFFDTRPDGLVVFLPFVAAKIREMLAQFAIVPVNGDPYLVELVTVPSMQGNASALQWHDAVIGTRSVLAVRWVFVPAETKRFMRAVLPGEEIKYASTSGVYAVLNFKAPMSAAAAPSGFPQGSAPSGIPGASAAPPADVFAELPPQLATEARALNATGQNADKMEAVAAELARLNFAASADALRARAKELRAKAAIDDIKAGRRFTIRTNDNPSRLARYYTGDADRWREILSANPGMRAATVDGVTQVIPWKVGSTINLPVEWDTSKPAPPVFSNGPGRPGADRASLEAP